MTKLNKHSGDSNTDHSKTKRFRNQVLKWYLQNDGHFFPKNLKTDFLVQISQSCSKSEPFSIRPTFDHSNTEHARL